MPRHVNHPRDDTLVHVFRRALNRARRADTGQNDRPRIIALAAVTCREIHRSGQGH